MQGDALALTDLRGEVGTAREVFVLLPPGAAPATATVNGQAVPFASKTDAGVTLQIGFAGRTVPSVSGRH